MRQALLELLVTACAGQGSTSSPMSAVESFMALERHKVRGAGPPRKPSSGRKHAPPRIPCSRLSGRVRGRPMAR